MLYKYAKQPTLRLHQLPILLRFETPILFLIFNRPDTTAVVFEQIKKIQPAQLFFAADGPRPWVNGEQEKCEATRRIVAQVDWNCEVKTLFRKENAGCGPAVSSAISWFFNEVEEGIILEDDCFPDISFFQYCRELLVKYRDVEKVKLIGGNNFQNGIVRGTGSYYFSHYPEIWGWATWRRVWKQYDFNMSDLEETLRADALKNAYTTAGEKKYWYNQLTKTKKGEINTWDYQLTYSIIRNGGVAISPQVNLVKNVGVHNNPTHLSLHNSSLELQTYCLSFPLIHPPVVVDTTADRYTFSQLYSRSVLRMLRMIKENGIKRMISYFFIKFFK